MVPGRPASSCERRGALALLSDAASSIVCGGAAGMIMWSVVPPCLPGSALYSSVLLSWTCAGGQHGALLQPKHSHVSQMRNLTLHLGYWPQTLLLDIASHCGQPRARARATTWAPSSILGSRRPKQHTMLCSTQWTSDSFAAGAAAGRGQNMAGRRPRHALRCGHA